MNLFALVILDREHQADQAGWLAVGILAGHRLVDDGTTIGWLDNDGHIWRAHGILL